MIKKLVNFRIDATLWENYQNYCKSIGISATESMVNHINSTLSNCKDKYKDNSEIVKTKYKDTDKQDKAIESIKNDLSNKQKALDNELYLLIQRLDKLEQDNNYLKQANNQLDDNLQLLKDNQDKLSEKIEKFTEENAEPIIQSSVIEAHAISAESADLSETDPPVKTIDYSGLTIALLQNKLDQLGIKYRKKATKTELLSLITQAFT